MKKTILFGAFSLVIVSLAVLTTAPIPAQAQVAACPAGYVCTPIVQTASNCPAGYVCTPTNTSTTNTGGYTGGYGGYTGSGGYAGSSGTGSTVTSTLCYNWATNLSIGSTGSDVVALQTFLVGKGFDIKNVSNKWTAKGYFGNQTVSALKNYQTSVGLPVTGALDAATRAQMNSSCSTTGTVRQPRSGHPRGHRRVVTGARPRPSPRCSRGRRRRGCDSTAGSGPVP